MCWPGWEAGVHSVESAAAAAAVAAAAQQQQQQQAIPVVNAAAAQLPRASPTLVRRGKQRMSLTFRQSR